MSHSNLAAGRLGPGGCGRPLASRQPYWVFVHLRTAEDVGVQEETPAIGEELDEAEKLRRLEAVIFLSPEGISSRKAAKLVGLADATEARTLIRKLNLFYDSAGRAFRIDEVAGGYALLTRSQFAPWLRKMSYVPNELSLGQSAIETLAIVAYRQPVLRANIEAIRGVGCSEVLKQLMALDLVRISGRSEELGRPYLYGTTRRFLQMFGLRSADRLPRMDWVNSFDSNTRPDATQESPSHACLDELKESTVKKTLTATALLEEESRLTHQLAGQAMPVVNVDEEDDDFYDDDEEEGEEDDDYGDDEDDFDDDDEWDDDEGDDEGEEDSDDDSDEEESEWEEVDDDDDDDVEEEDDDAEDWDDDEEDWDEEDDEDDDDWD